MAASVTVIGRTTRVRGRVSGEGDFQVEGLVVGEIVAGGDVTIEPHGIVGANIRGRRLVVRGAVQGDLLGEEAVVLEEGARVAGDVRAPRVAISQGALMRGHVQTGEDAGSPRPAARAHVAAKPVAVPARVPAPALIVPAPAAKALAAPKSAHAAPSGSAGSAARRPPPPIVPALKKMKGQMIKKKER